MESIQRKGHFEILFPILTINCVILKKNRPDGNDRHEWYTNRETEKMLVFYPEVDTNGYDTG